jgi:MFS family permease
MRFFSNSAINRVYVHSGLQGFATNCGGAFIYVYLLKAGIALPIVFAVIAAVMLARVPMRLLVLPVVRRIGLKQMLLLGTLIDASSYLVLGQVKGPSLWLMAYVAVASLGTAFYWTCFHTVMAKLGDDEHRASQVSTREAVFALTAIIGPLVGGAALTILGPFAAFAIAAASYALGVLPLLALPEIAIDAKTPLARPDKYFGFSLNFGDGLVAAAMNFGWKLTLFQALGSTFEAFGGALAVAGLVGAAMGMMFGRLIDIGKYQHARQIGIGVEAAAVLVSGFGYSAAWSALGATMLAALSGPIYMSSIMSRYYNAGKASGSTLRFNISGENGFDFGAGLGCLFAAVIIFIGGGTIWLPLVGLAGCAACYVALQRFAESAR